MQQPLLTTLIHAPSTTTEENIVNNERLGLRARGGGRAGGGDYLERVAKGQEGREEE